MTTHDGRRVVRERAPSIGWRAAAFFAGVVTGLGFAASALIGLALSALLGMGAPEVVPGLLFGGVVIAAVGFALHTVALVAVPPLTRWGVFGTAVFVGYAAVAAGTGISLAVATGPPAAAFLLIAVAVFTVSGAFLVPGAVAVMCSPLLDRRFARPVRSAPSPDLPGPPP